MINAVHPLECVVKAVIRAIERNKTPSSHELHKLSESEFTEFKNEQN